MEVLYLLILLVLAIFVLRKSPQREGFSAAFNKCRAKGYSKEFCIQTPATHSAPGGVSLSQWSDRAFPSWI